MVAYCIREASEGSRSPLWILSTVKKFSRESDRKLDGSGGLLHHKYRNLT